MKCFFYLLVLGVLNLVWYQPAFAADPLPRPTDNSEIWTAEDLVHVVDGTLEIEPSKTLIIEPGTKVVAGDSGNSAIHIRGTLIIRPPRDGLPGASIGENIDNKKIKLIFDSTNQPASIIEKADLYGQLEINSGEVRIYSSNLYSSISIAQGAKAILSANTINYNTSMLGSSALSIDGTADITQNIINSTANGISAVNFSGALSGNRVTSNGNALVLSQTANLDISANTLSSDQRAVSLENVVSAKITNNIVKASNVGIFISGNSNVTLEQNSISDNDTGIQITDNSAAILERNSLVNNIIAVHAQSAQLITLRYNDIYGNLPSLIGLIAENIIVNAQENWWGDPTGPNHISNPIGRGVSIAGMIDFEKWLRGYANLPLQASDIVVNEIFPFPSTEPKTEWIELANRLTVPVALLNLSISDTADEKVHKADSKFTSHWKDQPNIVTLPANGYAVITSNVNDFVQRWSPPAFLYAVDDQTIGRGLNNDKDEVFLHFNGLLSTKNYSIASTKQADWSYGAFDNDWNWTKRVTPGTNNILQLDTPMEIDGEEPAVGGETPTDDSCPVMKIGDIKQRLGLCVSIIGTVQRPSGPVFYLADETGEIKIYLQAARHIEKPRLYSGDTLRVNGIVDFYNNTWRILPRTSNDIVIVERYKDTNTHDEEESPVATSPPSQSINTAPLIPAAVAATTDSFSNTINKPIKASKALVKGEKLPYSSPDKVYNGLRLSLIAAFGLLLIILSNSLWRKYGRTNNT